MIQAEVEYLAGPSPRPIYHASSAGRHAAHEIDEPMRLVTVNVEDARQRPDNDEMDAFVVLFQMSSLRTTAKQIAL